MSPVGSNSLAFCTCNVGYEGGGDSACVNKNECLDPSANDCAVGKAMCTDNEGGFTCTCVEPYFGNGTFCAPRFVQIGMQIQVQVEAAEFQGLWKNDMISALADLCGIPISAVELHLLPAERYCREVGRG